MQQILFYLATIAVFAVLVVLLMGLWTVAGGKSPNLSQRLMRWRVGLQFGTVMIVLAYVLAYQYF